MNTLALILVLVAGGVLLRLAYLAMVGKDGYGSPGRERTLPRSHAPDFFDPRVPTRFV